MHSPSSPPTQIRCRESRKRVVMRRLGISFPFFSLSMTVNERFSGLNRMSAWRVPNQRFCSPSGNIAYTLSSSNSLFCILKCSMRPVLRWSTLSPPACVPMYTRPCFSSTYTAFTLLEPMPSLLPSCRV